MNFGSSSNESITSLNRPAHRSASGHEPSAEIRDPEVNEKDSSFKAQDQISSQPTVETLAALSDRESLNTETQFQ